MSPMPPTLLDLSLREFIQQLAEPQPTPGGGAAAALVAALAAALGQMVCGYTIGKVKFAAVEPQMRELAGRLERAAELLTCLIDEDARAYQQLSDALKLDKTDAGRAAQVQASAELAASVPFQTCAISHAALADLKSLAAIGNPMLKSDALAGAHLAQAACRAAAENVRANFGLMSAAAVARIEPELERLLAD
ncbi:Methenyltetrahydrofolate cyclohydrolase [Phycisphaerae bacterium RAS1]|nr:Methenyltetrahydrofolate cyclohydrolase [Phycisphaerae bacterium RAS1]